MIQIKNPTFGSDFELFVRDIETKEVVPCPIEFGGTKEEPLEIGNGCYRQIDGVAAEFNIPPVTNVDDWCMYIDYCINKGNEILLPLGLELVAETLHYFNEDQLTQPRHVEFGCTPSLCAYDMSENFPLAEQAGTMRTTGAHIHIGFPVAEDTNLDEVKRRLIFCMDKCVGIPFLAVDTDRERRKLYGQAGECRDKLVMKNDKPLYIVEYRCLGGSCIQHPQMMFDSTQQAIDLFNSDYVFTTEELELQENIINHKQEAHV